MEHKIIDNLFESHNNARDYLAKNSDLLIKDSELVGVEFRLQKGYVDVLLKKGSILYLVEIKANQSLYVARKQLFSYGLMFKKSKIKLKYRKLKYIIVKLQKYIGTDIYVYDDLDDVLSRKNNYHDIHYNRTLRTQQLPEIREKTIKATNTPEARSKWRKNMDQGIANRKKKLEESKHL